MAKKWLREGASVKARTLGSTDGWRVARRHLRNRVQERPGTVIGSAFGYRGEILLVEHEQGRTAAYHVDELAPA